MILSFGDCVLDTGRRALLRGGQPVHLTPKAFQLLTLLVDARPRAISRRELQETLWPNTYVSDTLPGLINELRVAIGESARSARYIRTLHGYGYAFGGDPAAAPAKDVTESVLVLPLRHELLDPEVEYLADGITESLLNAFSRVARFRVIARATAFRWKGSAEQPLAIARSLGADILIAGRMSAVRGGELVVHLEAVNVATETQLWGEKFRVERGCSLAAEEEIAREISRALQLRLSEKEEARLVTQSAPNPRAHDLYLRGRFHWNKRSGNWLQTAIGFFEDAIAVDADYALPHAGLADVFVAIGTRDLVPPREAFTRALSCAARALELDPSLAEAQTSMAAIKEVHLWEWAEAARRYGRAIELNPGYATAYHWLALHLARQRLFDKAEEQMARALDLDPLSEIILTNSALIAYLARDHETAVYRATRALEIDPESEGGRLVLGAALVVRGEHDAAIDVYRAALARPAHVTHTLAALGYALALSGRPVDALDVLERLHMLRREQHVSSADFALVTLGLGRVEEALSWLEAALEEKSGWLTYLATDARLDPIREEPRFRHILAAIHLTDA